MKCPKCGSEEINNCLIIPEVKSDTTIGFCKKCGYKIKHKDIYGKSMFLLSGASTI